MDSFFVAKKIRAAVKTKTCVQCELDKPLDEFSPDNKRCKICQANFYVTCNGCKKKRREPDMKIYDVALDRIKGSKRGYFCNEPCRNRYYGIKRDKYGYVKV